MHTKEEGLSNERKLYLWYVQHELAVGVWGMFECRGVTERVAERKTFAVGGTHTRNKNNYLSKLVKMEYQAVSAEVRRRRIVRRN